MESLYFTDGKIKAMFSTPNSTAAIQPINQGELTHASIDTKVIASPYDLKNELEDESVPKILKEINMKHVVFFLDCFNMEEASADSLQKECNSWFLSLRWH